MPQECNIKHKAACWGDARYCQPQKPRWQSRNPETVAMGVLIRLLAQQANS